MPFDPTGHKVLVSAAPRLKMSFYSTVGRMIFSIAAEWSFILSTRDAIMNWGMFHLTSRESRFFLFLEPIF
jgi:hypothetical protein